MAVYVDDAAIVWRSKKRFHLCADSVSELHEFAQRAAINKCWFHRKSRYPHYDVTEPQREVALSLGATALTSRDLVMHMRQLALTEKA